MSYNLKRDSNQILLHNEAKLNSYKIIIYYGVIRITVIYRKNYLGTQFIDCKPLFLKEKRLNKSKSIVLLHTLHTGSL